MNIEKYLEIFKGVYQVDTNNIEEALLALKNQGASQMESVRIIKNSLGLLLTQADNIVLNSKAWLATKEETLKLRNELFDDLEKLADDVKVEVNKKTITFKLDK